MTDDATDRWEYRAVRPPREATKKESRDPTDQLNDLAGEGWRLVETVEYVGGGTKYFVFERPYRGDDATESETRERRNRE
ncbi:protein of unknown function [Halogranum amylolyticum]|uniref:DUF4177 domain-containing protein n=1 Tax=Halogranum amylolyticum TaxID=660520 RepID=A0A1H8R846_9EURY|nr:DUF4177 domain-containing protein [Halogranum amylolyticum]SEO62314.1 protein of unknown function [Halogranum amylolyticum]